MDLVLTVKRCEIRVRFGTFPPGKEGAFKPVLMRDGMISIFKE
jgi:hypothetical protein